MIQLLDEVKECNGLYIVLVHLIDIMLITGDLDPLFNRLYLENRFDEYKLLYYISKPKNMLKHIIDSKPEFIFDKFIKLNFYNDKDLFWCEVTTTARIICKEMLVVI